MLAHTHDFNKPKEDVEGYFISEKYDGVRGIWDHKKTKMMTRNGLEYTIPDFLKEQLIYINMPLDGEIWFGYNTFDKCSGLARTHATDPEQWSDVKYMVFDIRDTEMPFEDRINILSSIESENVKPVKYTVYNSNEKHIREHLEEVENKGGEGLILRKPKSKYEYKRSKSMLKVKSWSYDEAEVIGYEEGTGRLKDCVGSLIVKNEEFGEFCLGSGLSDYQRKPLKDEERRSKIKEHNSDYEKLVKKIKKEKVPFKKIQLMNELNNTYQSIPVIGSIITFKYKETTKNNLPKFPIFICVRDYE